VHQGKQIFHCFGCGRGGNVYGFLMEIERITFIEAVRHLALKSHIELPVYERESDGPSESEQLVQANGLACDFFHAYLLNSQQPDAVSARKYLAGRGYTEQAIRAYMLGYAPDSWDKLTTHARNSRIPMETLLAAGLLKQGGETNRTYDAFRDRVTFPIRNLSGRVIGFGGRALKTEDGDRPLAKYINSPETAVYSKGRELFGLWEARNEIRRQDRAILVEGYTDTLSLISAGVEIVCASLGTSLTENQARLLKRFTQNVYVLYDGDSAGVNAAKRAVDVLLGAGCSPRVMLVPVGEDPDTFIRKEGAEALWELLNHSLDPVEFRVAAAKREGKTLQQIARELVASAAQIASPIDREAFLQEVSAKTGISVDALLREVPRHQPRSEDRQPARSNWPSAGPLTTLTEILVRNPEARSEVFEDWTPELVADEKLKGLLAHLHENWKAGRTPEPDTIFDSFSEPVVRNFLSKCLLVDEDANPDKQHELELTLAADCVQALRRTELKQVIAALKEKLAATPTNAEILSELQERMRELKTMKETGVE
jgi:DNA primase